MPMTQKESDLQIENYIIQLEQRLEEYEDEIDARDAIEALKEPGYITHEELKKELGL